MYNNQYNKPVSSTSTTYNNNITASTTQLNTPITLDPEEKVQSIDDALQELLNDGNLSKDDLDKIHRLIGYNSDATHTDMNALSQANLDSSLYDHEFLAAQGLTDPSTSQLPSQQGYKQAWEKLSTRLEALEDTTRAAIPFTSAELNPYMANNQVLLTFLLLHYAHLVTLFTHILYFVY